MLKILCVILFFYAIGEIHGQDALPHMDLVDLYGNDVQLKEISRDKLIVISLWATWCVPCIKELDAINQVYGKWKEELGVTLYALSVDDSRTIKRVKPMIRGKGWEYDILLDPNNNFRRRIGAATIPLTLIVRDNKILYRQAKFTPGVEDLLFEKLREFTVNKR